MMNLPPVWLTDAKTGQSLNVKVLPTPYLSLGSGRGEWYVNKLEDKGVRTKGLIIITHINIIRVQHLVEFIQSPPLFSYHIYL